MEREESVLTVTQREQQMVEGHVFSIYHQFGELPRSAKSVLMELARDNHVDYLTNGLRRLPPSFCVLDANRPWLCYWILHSLALLGENIDGELKENAIDFLNRCQDPDGGYGGGPGQMPHLATTYAAVNSLITVGGHKALASINRDKLYSFLRRMKDTCGGFRMHVQGEMDVRACYTAVSVASAINILDHDLVENVGNYILSCQTYEGGIAGEPGSEAHGGYTFCGVATMILIDEVQRLDLPRLMNWAVFRQGVECGFQGRTNKLVDGCYSFWQGGVCALIQRLLSVLEDQLVAPDKQDGASDPCSKSDSSAGPSCPRGPLDYLNVGLDFVKRHPDRGPLFHSLALQQYILLCSQVQEGGFRDKPGKARDFYHTCYCLSGLSVCQYTFSNNSDADADADAYSTPPPEAIMGPYFNLVEPVHPLYNIVLDQYHEAVVFFSRL